MKADTTRTVRSWGDYYAKLDFEHFLGNLCTHRQFLTAIHALARASGSRVLEVGTGTGSMAVFLSQVGIDVTVLDNEGRVLELARDHNREFNGRLTRFLLGDTFDLPLGNDSFDLVFHQGLFEHFSDTDVKRALAEQLRVAPTVVFSVPNQFYPHREYGDERLMSLARWQKILEGFEVADARPYGWKLLPQWYVPRARIQNLFVVLRADRRDHLPPRPAGRSAWRLRGGS